jgi:hypothetical protein
LGVIDPTPMTALLVGSVLVGGVPYIVFAVLGLLFLWHREPQDYVRAAVLAPVAFIPFLVVFWWVAIEPIRSPLELFDAFVFMFCLGVPIGYGYVGLFALGRWLVSRLGTETHARGTV